MKEIVRVEIMKQSPDAWYHVCGVLLCKKGIFFCKSTGSQRDNKKDRVKFFKTKEFSQG